MGRVENTQCCGKARILTLPRQPTFLRAKGLRCLRLGCICTGLCSSALGFGRRFGSFIIGIGCGVASRLIAHFSPMLGNRPGAALRDRGRIRPGGHFALGVVAGGRLRSRKARLRVRRDAGRTFPRLGAPNNEARHKAGLRSHACWKPGLRSPCRPCHPCRRHRGRRRRRRPSSVPRPPSLRW